MAAKQLPGDVPGRPVPYLPAAFGAEDPADFGEKESQVIVDHGRRTHRRARVPDRIPALDRNGRREPRYIVHVRTVDALEELPRVGRQALDIPPETLRIERIQGQRGLSRTAQSGHDRKFMPGYRDRYIL